MYMKNFIVENGILKSYRGRDSIVVVPEGECRGLFEKIFLNEKVFNKAFEVQDGKLYFVSFEGYNVLVEDKESFLAKVKATLKRIEGKY